ncbi:MAG TPA: flavodoxin domain-containing protein [Ktedonobacteraceae bacterium]|nr:flavodoxin domain-containing protein [Ktedonobacteraceae bacterium]
MSASVLVAYATRYGSTQEVAETITTILREGGLEVDLKPINEVHNLEDYDAVVLGAALYIGRWHKDARRFLLRHGNALSVRPVAIFALGPLHSDEHEKQGARAALDKDLAKFPWLAPIDIEMFGGKLDASKLHFPDSLMTKVPASPFKDIPISDVRDWVEIREWASKLALKLYAAMSHTSEVS